MPVHLTRKLAIVPHKAQLHDVEKRRRGALMIEVIGRTVPSLVNIERSRFVFVPVIACHCAILTFD